jgi:hypothetical protein
MRLSFCASGRAKQGNGEPCRGEALFMGFSKLEISTSERVMCLKAAQLRLSTDAMRGTPRALSDPTKETNK